MEYYEHERGVSQYADITDLAKLDYVNARYINPTMDGDKGNPCIEALPPPRPVADLDEAYMKLYPGYRYEDVRNMTDEEKLDQIDLLQLIRFPLKFHEDLERFVRSVILSSYRIRRRKRSEDGIIYVVKDEERITDSYLKGDSSEGTNSGLAVTGVSGSGKTSTIHLALSYYPQYINHEGIYGRFPQIVWLVVNCVPNSNFSAICRSIGVAIDDVVGNGNYYEKQIVRERSLGDKVAKVKELIKKFSIGCLVLDEIQLIDFESMKENSYDTFLEIANSTKVGLIVVGTEEARKKMFPNRRTGRRVGYELHSDDYCSDKEYFRLIVEFVWHYQWFDSPVELTDEIVDVLYDLSKGLVSHLVNIYRCVNYDYISKDTKPAVDAAYIRKIALRYFSGLQELLESEEFNGRVDETAVARDAAEALLAEFRQKAVAKRVADNQEAVAEKQVIFENVYSLVHTLYPEFSGDTAQDAFNRVMKRKISAGKSEGEIARLVVDELQKKPKRPASKTKPATPDHVDLMNFLNIESEDES